MNFNNQIIVVPPVGSVTAFLGDISSYNSSTTQSSSPNSTGLHPVEGYGWMVCDGRTLQKDEYPELYGMLGNIYGGDENTFNIPDLRGMFLRGVGSDPASIEDRTNPKGGSGDTQGVGSIQDFALQTHIHTYTAPSKLTPSEGTEGTTVSGFDQESKTSIPQKTPDSTPDIKVSQFETRPSNVFVYYIIKFTNHLPYFNSINS